MNVLDLFSGIGGFSLGLERSGMRTVAFCEIEPYCRAVLRKHWPNVPCYDDVRTLTADRLSADGIIPDVICGGFPCQDISTAGKGAGIEGARSGLWREYARLIGEVRPAFVIVENVAALLSRGLDRVLGDLATLGYDAEWHCIPASAVGAPHRRDRVWIIANANPCLHPRGLANGKNPFATEGSEGGDHCKGQALHGERVRVELGASGEILEDAKFVRRPQMEQQDGRAAGSGRPTGPLMQPSLISGGDGGWWHVEPSVGRMADGVPNRVDRLSALGNAVVPQIPQIIGEAIMKSVAA